MEDYDIIQLYWDRNEQAIQDTSIKYEASLKYISKNILFHDQDVKECVNDTYLTAWNTMPPTWPNHLGSYLKKIIRNLSLKKQEYNHAEKRNVLMEELTDEIEQIVSNTESPEEQFDAKEVTAIINNFLSQCSKTDRILFVQRYWYCAPIHDIATRYGLSDSNVKVRLYRLRKNLKKHLIQEGIQL